MSAGELEEFDVAVVVFVRATGVDRIDASHRAERAVLTALGDNVQVVTMFRGYPVLEVPGDRAEQNVTVVGAIDLQSAASGGDLQVRPSLQPFRSLYRRGGEEG